MSGASGHGFLQSLSGFSHHGHSHSHAPTGDGGIDDKDSGTKSAPIFEAIKSG
jgi:hypothetical protein